MEISEAIHRRRSVRRFRPEAPSEDLISSILDSSRFAHSIGNMQLLRYTAVLKPDLVQQLQQQLCLEHIHNEGESPSDAAPPVYIACVVPRGGSPMLYADAGAAFQNMGLTAYSLGVHLFWVHAFAQASVDELLQLEPGQQCLAIYALGFPAENPIAVNAPTGGYIERTLGETRILQVPKLPLKTLVNWII